VNYDLRRGVDGEITVFSFFFFSFFFFLEPDLCLFRLVPNLLGASLGITVGMNLIVDC
jgi:hypothetical protein